MTPPMTRPVHPTLWMVVVGAMVVVLAVLFLRSDGLLGGLALVVVEGVAAPLWITCILGVAWNYLDSRQPDGHSFESSERSVGPFICLAMEGLRPDWGSLFAFPQGSPKQKELDAKANLTSD